MAEKGEDTVNVGEEITDAPTTLPIKPEDQFRVLTLRIDALTNKVGGMEPKGGFRIANFLELAGIVIAILVAVGAAVNQSQRIEDVRADQISMEKRLTDASTAAEGRLTTKLDRLADQFTSMDERTARLEGEKSGQAAR